MLYLGYELESIAKGIPNFSIANQGYIDKRQMNLFDFWQKFSSPTKSITHNQKIQSRTLTSDKWINQMKTDSERQMPNKTMILNKDTKIFRQLQLTQ
jgi:hypothetical protein